MPSAFICVVLVGVSLIFHSFTNSRSVWSLMVGGVSDYKSLKVCIGRCVASIIGFSIVNVKRALLQRSCGIYISRYRYIVWSCVNLYQTERYVLAIGLGNSWILSSYQRWCVSDVSAL